jgi:hypothetical protein
MKVGIVSDGKYGERAFEIIRERFPTEWIPAPYIESPIADDIELDLPECDLYLSYVRHPDIALSIIDTLKPVILGVSFGPGFLRQARTINHQVEAPVTMCSLEENTPVPEINEFAKVFGKPTFIVRMKDEYTLDYIEVVRGSPCGSTVAASAELSGSEICQSQLQNYGLRICHWCRAPRFGTTCDKEISGLIHVTELVRAIRGVSPAAASRVEQWVRDMQKISTRKIMERR